MEKSPGDSLVEGCEMITFRFRILLFAVIFLILTISNAISDGNVHVEGQVTFPFPSKKATKKIVVWSGIVVGVSDGDTISVLHEGKWERELTFDMDITIREGKRLKKTYPVSLESGGSVLPHPSPQPQHPRGSFWARGAGGSGGPEKPQKTPKNPQNRFSEQKGGFPWVHP